MSKLNKDFNRNFLVNLVVLLNIIRGREVGKCDSLDVLEKEIMEIFVSLIAVNYEARDFGVKRGKEEVFLYEAYHVHLI